DPSPRFETWTTADGLSSNNTRALADDRAGRIYVGTEQGVDRIEVESRRIRHYTTADGLASNEIEVATTAADGSLWFGTYSGLSRLIPESTAPRDPPAVWITAVRAAGTAVPITALGASHVPVPAP